MSARAPTREPAPAVTAVQRVLVDAAQRGASDVHLDPDEQGVRVRARIDGVLLDVERLPADVASNVIGRLKALSGLLAYRTDVPQEGRISAERSPTGGELRVATYPTLDGERAAIRIDSPDAVGLALDDLGLPAAARTGLSQALQQPEGVVLLTGPSGSGKTTTLYACLRQIAGDAPGRSLMTLEDPVERRIPGVVQTEVSEPAGLTFARALRSLLRQDPDVLLVGEIRDRETAAIALEAGLTGHLVASTVHAGTATAVYTRLLEMGVEPFVLTSAIRGVLAQRLLRRTCDACSGQRCADCRDTGYRGRVVVAEWVPMAPALRDAVLARADGERLADAADGAGYGDLWSVAARLVERGLTTRQEVDRVLGHA
jgi:type II secretory ATPase GspE/PulE/Tfp pilus assembly ATPase PilB-like protein